MKAISSRRTTWRRRLLTLIGVLGLSYIAACLYFSSVQVEKIFDPVPDIFTDPGRMGIGFAPVKIPLGSGGDPVMLDGIWVPAAGGLGASRAPSILYLHGQDTTVGKNLEHTLQLQRMGYNVLLVDYRGYGDSYYETRPSEASVYEDAEAAWQYLIREHGVEASRAFIYGHSLGGAIAIELAIKHPRAAGLIVESTFTSVGAMSRENHPIAAVVLPMGKLIRHRFDSIDKIGKLQIPVLLIHGLADAKIPFKMTDQLFLAAPEPKEKLLIKGGEHANCSSVGWIEYRDKVSAFVEKYGPAR